MFACVTIVGLSWYRKKLLPLLFKMIWGASSEVTHKNCTDNNHIFVLVMYVYSFINSIDMR